MKTETQEEKLQKEQEVFARTPVMRALLKLAFPTIIGQMILVVYNMADAFFIGMRGNDAMLSAVTVCMPAFMFLSAIANLFGIGGASVMARSLGAKDLKRAHRASDFAFWGTIFSTFIYTAGVFLLRHPFLNLLGATDGNVHAYAIRYLLVTVVLGGIASSLSITLSHLLRAEGHSIIASFGISMGGVCNIALDPLFMFYVLPAGNEVLGAAIATALSNLCSLLFFAIVIAVRGREKSNLRFKLKRNRLFGEIPLEVLTAGIPACVMTLFENISYAVLDKQLSFYGTELQAGVGVAKKVNMMAHSIVRGITQGALPLIAFNYAAGDKKRMCRAIHYATILAVTTALSCMGVCLLAAPQLVGLFIRHASASKEAGALFLRILCVGAPFSAFAYTYISAFQAVGKSARSFILAILRKGIVDIPLMFLLQRFFRATGVVLATPAADIVCCGVALVMAIRFLKAARKEAASYVTIEGKARLKAA
ncbi:MAG: MATE family efflux transporter [Lachnospiraceae bacterium]|nr:MATE family efflux transporter [Lachnospiraceae bacterium]